MQCSSCRWYAFNCLSSSEKILPYIIDLLDIKCTAEQQQTVLQDHDVLNIFLFPTMLLVQRLVSTAPFLPLGHKRFPCPCHQANMLYRSQWKHEKIEVPWSFAISWTGMYFQCFPTLNSMDNSSICWIILIAQIVIRTTSTSFAWRCLINALTVNGNSSILISSHMD